MPRWLRPLPVFLGLLLAPLLLCLLFPDGLLARLGIGISTGVGCLFLGFFIHELGHIVAGAAVGMRPWILAAGPISLRWEPDGIRLSEHRSWAQPAFAHFSELPPKRPGRELRHQLAWVMAGGPLANLACALLGALVLGGLLAWDPGFHQAGAGRALWKALLAFIFMSTVFGLGNLVPFSVANARSDGAALRILRRPGRASERLCALWRLHFELDQGTPPHACDPALVRSVVEPCDGSLDELGARVVAHLCAYDRGELEEAAAHLERADELSRGRPVWRQHLGVQAAVFEALARSAPERGRSWLAEVAGSPLVPAHARLTAEAAVLAAEGGAVAARECLERAREALRKAPPMEVRSAAIFEKWLDGVAYAVESLATPAEQSC